MMDKACFPVCMKFLLLAGALTLASCKPEAPEPEQPKPVTEAQIREIRTEQVNLLNKKLQLEKQLDRLVAASQVDPNNDMKRIIAERQQAYLDLQKIRSTHPSLQKLNEELSEWRVREQSARSSKSTADASVASETIGEISSKLQTLSKELPSIREAQDRIDRSEQEIKDLRRSLAAKTAEGKTLIDEIQQIEDSLASPR